jgi:hypothetical protein
MTNVPLTRVQLREGQGCTQSVFGGFSRRRFGFELVRLLVAVFATGCEGRLEAESGVTPGPKHPDPRSELELRGLVAADKRLSPPHVIRAFEEARRASRVFDSIRCPCRCSRRPGRRSLLSCFEGDGMARDCDECLAAAEFVAARYREGQSLIDIRASFDHVFTS